MHDTREGATHLVSGSRFHKGAKPSQGGQFSDHILCERHENVTASLDKYGTEFVRMAERRFRALDAKTSFQIENARPTELLKFALSVIWREVASSGRSEKNLSLGPYWKPVIDAVFGSGELSWPTMIQRTRFFAGDALDIKLGIHPHTIRFEKLNAWTFTVAGFAFFIVSDRRGLPRLPQYLSANEGNPLTIIVADKRPISEVGILQPILSNMRLRGK